MRFFTVLLASSLLWAAHHTLALDPAALYQSDNALYFGNQLPKDISVTEGNLDDDPWGKKVYGGTYHTPGTHSYQMRINPNDDYITEQEVVLHESCHIRVWEDQEYAGAKVTAQDHGPQFQSCMLDLAKKGAFANIW